MNVTEVCLRLVITQRIDAFFLNCQEWYGNKPYRNGSALFSILGHHFLYAQAQQIYSFHYAGPYFIYLSLFAILGMIPCWL
jgi:hypothetical protein